MKVGHMYVNSLGAPRRNEYQRHRSDLRFLSLLAAALMGLTAATAHGEVVDDVIDALKIRDYLRASEEQCRNAALGQAQRQVAESVNARLAGRVLSDHERSRIEELSRTYAREACRLGIDEGLIQRYRAAYRAALSDSELDVPSEAAFGRIGFAIPKSRSLTTPSGVMRMRVFPAMLVLLLDGRDDRRDSTPARHCTKSR